MHWFNTSRWRSFHVAFARLRILIVLLGLVPFFYLAKGPPLWLALVFMVPGELLQLWAAANLFKNEALAQTGPYAWIRNPMYVGRFLVGVGLTLIVAVWWWLLPVYVVIYAVYVHARVLREEGRLREYLGEPYVEYCSRVGRWLPRRLGRLHDSLSWSWENVRRNRQLRVTAALLVVLLLVVVRRTL
jgi:protein-S-isoprenylcysteine O-methyltransferase Ste14